MEGKRLGITILSGNEIEKPLPVVVTDDDARPTRERMAFARCRSALEVLGKDGCLVEGVLDSMTATARMATVMKLVWIL